MGKRVTWIDTSREVAKVWYDLCPPGEYRLVEPGAVPAIVPPALVRKAHIVLAAGSATPCGDVYYMANVHRVDGPGRAIDQEPFGIAFVANSPTTSGCLIHHGAWTNRTVVPPPSFWEAVHQSDFSRYAPFSELPREPAGSLSELRVSSQLGAFEATIERMRRFVDEKHEAPGDANKGFPADAERRRG